MEFPAWIYGLQNDIAISVHDEGNDMYVSPDWHQEQPLPWTLGMLQDIYILLLQDHLGNFLKRDSSLGLELVALVFIPDEVHYEMNDILYTMSNGLRGSRDIRFLLGDQTALRAISPRTPLSPSKAILLKSIHASRRRSLIGESMRAFWPGWTFA